MHMKSYEVTITEKLEMTVSIEASSRAEAEALVERNWKDSQYILDADHFKGATFKARLPERERDFVR